MTPTKSNGTLSKVVLLMIAAAFSLLSVVQESRMQRIEKCQDHDREKWEQVARDLGEIKATLQQMQDDRRAGR